MYVLDYVLLKAISTSSICATGLDHLIISPSRPLVLMNITRGLTHVWLSNVVVRVKIFINISSQHLTHQHSRTYKCEAIKQLVVYDILYHLVTTREIISITSGTSWE